MAGVFIRLSVFWKNRQLDVSLPAERPVVDIIDDVTGLLTATDTPDANPRDTVVGTRAWVLSSPTTGILTPDSTLSDYNIVDGHRLYLTQRADAAHSPFVDDVMTEVRRTITDNQWRWSDTVRQGGLLLIAGLIALALLLPALKKILDAPQKLTEWSTTDWIMLGITTTLSLTALGISIWQPRSATRWLALVLPIAVTATTYPLIKDLPAGLLCGILLATAAATSIPAAIISGKGRERNGLAGAITLIGLSAVGVTISICDYYGVSMLALAAWTSWVPIALLLIAPSVAVNSSGLATLLRQSDAGDAVSRENIRKRTLRSAALCDALVWFATALGALIIAALGSSPYWQQGIPAFILALVLLFRSNGFSDARLISPLLLCGAIGISICAASLYPWINNRSATELVHNPWWNQTGAENWQPWLIAGIASAIFILIFLLMLGYKPNEVQEARSAKIISGIDTVISITAIPAILIAQGVLTYYWATI